MRVLAGGIYHESHSFSNIPTDIEAFKSVLYLQGREVVEELGGTVSEMAGFIEGAEKYGFELIPTLWAWGLATGPVTAAALDEMIGVVHQAYQDNDGIDGVLFTLHGAMVSEPLPDGDGYILSRFREFMGDVHIAVTLDLHANISSLMVEKADIIVGYDTYPHIDQVERGLEAAELLARAIRDEIKPVMSMAKPPMVVVPNRQFTAEAPMKHLFDLAIEAEAEPGVLSVTVAGGFAYSDVPEIGPAVVVITDNNAQLGQQRADAIADRFWELRDDFVPKPADIPTAVQRAIESSSTPVILADVGDNIGAGTPGDSTFILGELLDKGATDTVVIIADPSSVEKAVSAGVGERVSLQIGGKTDRFHGEPVEVRAEVTLISNGVFRNRGQMRDGIVEDMGRTAVVAVGGVRIVLTEKKMPPWNLEQLRSVGISPESQKIIVVKSAVAFRAAYEPIAGEIIEVDSPGLSSVNLGQFNFKNIRPGLFPFS